MEFKNIENIKDINDVIGRPVVIDKYTTIIPISRVSYGYVGGNTNFKTNKNNDANDGQIKGYGMTVYPLGILILGEKNTYIKTDENIEEDKWINLIKCAINTLHK